MKRDHKTRQSSNISSHEPLHNTGDFNDHKRRWPPEKVATTRSPEPAAEDMDDSEELIEDDYDSYDELFTQHFTDEGLSQLDGTETASASQSRRSSPSPSISRKTQKSAKTTNRFLLSSKSPPVLQFTTGILSKEGDGLPWAQRYAPLNLTELAVHKRKVCDVEQWLSDALAGKAHRSLLVLKGPAGSGKTTTISLLAGKLNLDTLEWKTPSALEYATQGYVSLGVQFDEFLNRGQNFSGLDLDNNDDPHRHMEGEAYTPRQRIILIEEFPTLSGRSFSTLAAFRLSLLRYISMKASPTSKASGREPGIPPIVMIVSETFSDSESPFDNLTVHRLLGRDIYNHPSTTVIEFNSIAPTFMSKALKLVIEKSSRHFKSNQAPVSSVIESISKTGDIRNAIASLEFLCLSSDKQRFQSNFTPKTKGSTRKRKEPASSSKDVPKEISQRQTSLGLFHAVGKIVYNKRDDTLDAEHGRLPPPPDHFRDFDRPQVSQADVNRLLDETGTDTPSFISALHENYVPSCNGPSFTECLDSCIGALSDSDLLSSTQIAYSDRQAGLGPGFIKHGASVDLLRQEELSYQVAARGLIFALPYPVKRQVSSTSYPKRTNDSYKLSFPPAIQLRRQMEEIRDLIHSCTEASFGSSIGPAAVPMSYSGLSTFPKTTHDDGARDKQNPAATLAMISRSEMILYQLPYMTLIHHDGAELGNVKKITSFSRSGVRNANHSMQQDEELSWRPSWQHSRFKHQNQVGWFRPQAPLTSQAYDERSILSDDEIVDD